MRVRSIETEFGEILTETGPTAIKQKSLATVNEQKNLIHKNLILTALFSLREHMNENLLLITIGKKPHHFALKMQCTPLTSICSDVNISQHPPVKLHLFISFHSLSRFYS